MNQRTLFLSVIGSISILLFTIVTFDLSSVFPKSSFTLPFTKKPKKKHHILGGEDDDRYHGRYPNSLLTLFFPYTLLRDVVLDQPVEDTDVPFFWHIHKSDETIMKYILTTCYGLDTVELNDLQSIERAKQVHLASRGNKIVITSPFIRQAAELFDTENFGRMFCFFRHPLDYDLHDDLPTFSRDDNWLTRLLSDDHDNEVIGFKELGVAKQVVRQTCVVGTLDKMELSVYRMADYYGWELQPGQDETCVSDVIQRYNPPEKWIDHESEEWYDFYRKNKYDCQLYELAQSTWRAQIQTIIPLATQLTRAAPDEDEDEEEEE